MKPRRQQATISFRSDRAKARLAVFTSAGRSQAEIIEEALDRLPDPPAPSIDKAARRARIETILDRLAAGGLPTIAEFDREEYDENGSPR